MRTMRTLPATFGLILLCVLTMPAQAEVYKWLGPDGVVQYGQLPPAGVQAQAVGTATVEAGADEVADGAEPAPDVPDESALERIRAEQAAREDKRKVERDEYCTRARSEFQRLDETPSHRLAQIGEDGERVRMTQEEYDTQRAKLQAAIEEHCG